MTESEKGAFAFIERDVIQQRIEAEQEILEQIDLSLSRPDGLRYYNEQELRQERQRSLVNLEYLMGIERPMSNEGEEEEAA